MLGWSLIAVPTGVGAALACCGRRTDRFAAGAGIVCAGITLVLAVLAMIRRPAVTAPLLLGIDARFAVDGLSAVLIVVVAVTTLAVLLFARGRGEESGARFTGLMLLFAGAMLATTTAGGLVPLLMGWEVMGAASWALIGWWWRDPDRTRSADIAFLTTRAADLGLYIAAGAALAGGAAGLGWNQLIGTERPWRDVLTAGIVLAALGKSAQLPFAFWLARAMRGPSTVSALLHSATMVAAGGYLLLRVHPLLPDGVAWFGAVTALMLGLVAIAQTDLKQLLAASTSAQLGFVVLAAGIGDTLGGTAQLVAHAVAKPALFLTAGAWLTALGAGQLSSLRGAARRYPVVGGAFTVAAASLAGIPPLSLWVAKEGVLATAVRQDPALAACAFAAVAVSACYSTKAVWFCWRPAPDRSTVPRISVLGRSVLVGLAGVAAVLGAGVPPIAALLGVAVVVPAAWQLGMSAGLAIAVSAVTWWWGDRRWTAPAVRPLERWLAGWLGLERLAEMLLLRPVWTLARTLAAIDDRVLDRAVLAIAAAGVRSARTLHGTAERGVEGAVRAVARAASRIGVFARRPQTGQVHQYYAQAVVALAALVLLVVLVR